MQSGGWQFRLNPLNQRPFILTGVSLENLTASGRRAYDDAYTGEFISMMAMSKGAE